MDFWKSAPVSTTEQLLYVRCHTSGNVYDMTVRAPCWKQGHSARTGTRQNY